MALEILAAEHAITVAVEAAVAVCGEGELLLAQRCDVRVEQALYLLQADALILVGVEVGEGGVHLAAAVAHLAAGQRVELVAGGDAVRVQLVRDHDLDCRVRRAVSETIDPLAAAAPIVAHEPRAIDLLHLSWEREVRRPCRRAVWKRRGPVRVVRVLHSRR